MVMVSLSRHCSQGVCRGLRIFMLIALQNHEYKPRILRPTAKFFCAFDPAGRQGIPLTTKPALFTILPFLL